MSSDGGAVLLQAADRVLEVVGRIAACFDDYRDPGRTEHGLEALLLQRVFGIGMGYGDLNDHDEIRRDSVLALACGREDLTGEKQARTRDRAYPLAGSSTLIRLELGTPGSAESHRCKKIVADPEKLDALLVDLFLDMHPQPPEEIVLDLDATDDQVHGNQEAASTPSGTRVPNPVR